MRHLGGLLLASSIGAAGIVGACGSDTTPSQFLETPDATPDGVSGDGPANPDDSSIIGTDIVSVAIDPPNPVIQVQNGVVPAATAFKATGTTVTGAKVTLSAGSWTYDRFDVATMDQLQGNLAATGFIGGVGNVTYKYRALTAKTTATVVLKMSAPDNVPPPVKGAFGTATDPDPAMALVYPYDKTVFPRGMTAPVVQWNGGGAADIYHIKVSGPTATFEAYTTAAPPSRYTLPILAPSNIDVWRKLTDSTTGALTVAIQRYDGTKAYLPKTQTWTIAPANLAGTIYFWEVNNGNVVRIKPGAAAPESFLQKPNGATCVACHSVSKNGKTLVASFNGGASPWGTFDALTGANLFVSDTTQGATYASGFQAISPDGQFVLWRHWSDGAFGSLGYLSLSKFNDPAELAKLTPGAGSPGHQAWSSDGKQIAFSVRTDGNGLDFTTSTIWTSDVTVSPPAFTNIHKIVDNTATRTVATYPAYSPDSKWIAFERSTQARSRGAQSEIWMTKSDGSVLIELNNTNGKGVVAQADANYEPTFMPVAVGGYFWLVIVSERTYGNTLTDTATATRHKQLWVTAIDANPVAGADPSHPSFWLPGQDTGNQNMRGEWALNPCKGIGEGCSAGYECCDGFCRGGTDGGAPVCAQKPPGCAANGDKCLVPSDCCTVGAQCIAGFCNDIPR